MRGKGSLWKRTIIATTLFYFLFFVLNMVWEEAEQGQHGEKARTLAFRTKTVTRQIRRVDDDQQYLDLFKDETEETDRVRSYAHKHIDFGVPQCGCRREEVRTHSFETAQNTTVISMRSPSRRYHSNHWFHIGEHFLSMHHSSALKSVVRAGDTLILVANDAKFVKDMTFMSAFLILIALAPGEGCADGSIRHSRLEVYEPSSMHPQQVKGGGAFYWSSFASYSPSITLDMSGPVGGHFRRIDLLEHASEEVSAGRQCHCGKLISSLGAEPVPSSKWFSSEESVREIKDKVHALCAKYPPAEGSTSLLRRYREGQGDLVLTVYERDISRHFANLDSMMEQLSMRLDARWGIDILYHDEGMHPCQLHAALRHTTLYLTTHGFQSTAVMFMRRGSAIVEVFPYKYFKRSYEPLAAAFGVAHHWTQNPRPTSGSREWLRLVPQSWCMGINRCRSLARGDNVAMPNNHIDFVVGVAEDLASQRQR